MKLSQYVVGAAEAKAEADADAETGDFGKNGGIPETAGPVEVPVKESKRAPNSSTRSSAASRPIVTRDSMRMKGDKDEELWRAAEDGQVGHMNQLLKEGARPDRQVGVRGSFCHCGWTSVASPQLVQISRMLPVLFKCYRLQPPQDEDGKSALYKAAEMGHKDAVVCLIEGNADLDLASKVRECTTTPNATPHVH